MLKWYEQSGYNDDVVLQTRVRLARNLNGYRFADRLAAEDAIQMVNRVVGRFQADWPDTYHCLFMNNCNQVEKNALKERQVISSWLSKGKNGAVLLNQDDSVSVMLNAEDHVRIQVLSSGMNMSHCFQTANSIDDYIDEHFEYAYDEVLGYKTSFPTNVGTGLRASYTLHLPALSDAKRMQQIGTELSRFGIKFKNIYGDDEGNYGHLYQIASQRTLGLEESEIIKDLNDIVMQLVKQEREQRQQFYERDCLQMEDEIFKSYGVLKYARKLSLKDAMVLFSEVLLGISLGILSFEPTETISANQFFMDIQPATLLKQSSKDLSVMETDVLRAEYFRRKLPELL